MIKTVLIEQTVDEKVCRRCLGAWFAKVPNPKVCALCKSPYWDKDRLRTGSAGAVNKYGFDALADFKWHYFPFALDGKDRFGMDWRANDRRARSLDQFCRRRNWIIEHKLGKNEKGEVCLMVRRYK